MLRISSHRVKLGLAGLLFVAATAAAGTGATGAGGAGKRPAQPYERDRHLTGTSVRLEPRVGVSLGSVVRKLSEAAEVPLVCQAALRGRPVGHVVNRELAVSEWMRDVAATVPARWARVGRGYVLCEEPELAALAVLEESQLYEAIGQAGEALLGSFTPEQLARLRTGTQVPIEELSPGQRRSVLKMAALAFTAVPGLYRPEALSGEGAYLDSRYLAPESNGKSVSIMLPSYEEGGFVEPWGGQLR